MNRIKELREKKGMSIDQLSKELKKKGVSISPASISKYEREDRKPKIDKWVQLADFFNVSVPYLQGLTNYQGIVTDSNSFQKFAEADGNKNQNGDLYFSENSWHNFVKSLTSQEALDNFKKLYATLNDLDFPIKKFDFNKILQNVDSLTELNTVTEYTAYVYEVLVSNIVNKDKQNVDMANKIKKIIDNMSVEE